VRFPFWIFILFAIFFVGPMMRSMFGEGERAAKRIRSKQGRKSEQNLEAALEQRDQVIEDLQQRISELESRLDFTERMLASPSHKDPAQV
jgi:hypothetical protein